MLLEPNLSANELDTFGEKVSEGVSALTISIDIYYSYAYKDGLHFYYYTEFPSGVTVSGSAVVPYFTSGGILIGGESQYTNQLITDITISGQAEVNFVYDYVGTGFILMSGLISSLYGYLIYIDQSFEWNIQTEVSDIQQFEWNIGSGVRYWYRVASCCKPGHGSCPDAGCSSPQTTITNVLATSVSDVCSQMLNRGTVQQICDISKFSRAAFLADRQALTAQGVDQQCNTLTPVSYCQVPVCMQFCIDYNVNIYAGVYFDQNLNYYGSGVIQIGGSSLVAIDTRPHKYVTSLGGVVVSGTASVTTDFATSGQWSFIWLGGIIIGGTAIATITGSGDLTSCQIPDSLLTLILTDEFGSVTLYRTASNEFVGCAMRMVSADQYDLSYVSCPVRYSFFCSSNPAYQLTSDTCENNTDHFVWRLGIGYPTNPSNPGGGYAGYTCDTITEAQAVTDTFSPPNRQLISTGAASFPVNATFEYADCSGWAPGYWTMSSYWFIYNKHTNIPTSTITVVEPPALFALSTDNNIGIQSIQAGGLGSVLNLSLGYDGTATINPITTTTKNISTSCSCSSIPTEIQMSHSLSSANYFSNFLNRNNLSIATTLPMYYNSTNSCWQTNLHYSGISADGVTDERWDIVFEWMCSTRVAGYDTGSNVWILGIFFKNKNLSSLKTTVSRLLFSFVETGPCLNGQINFTVTINPLLETILTNPSYQVTSKSISDGIGLFSGQNWNSTSTFQITLAVNAQPANYYTQNISSIFGPT